MSSAVRGIPVLSIQVTTIFLITRLTNLALTTSHSKTLVSLPLTSIVPTSSPNPSSCRYDALQDCTRGGLEHT
ncbi:hypothetical protein BCR34DRAFT_568834 [Clohesyomyces aquaticus]|uniref:Uncharacterized protein n=1 Tax=Clohesyomyces aquaticus TaxID=1231657 RepID=A0A1Y1ZFT3_9PLEO|nr:hypothetical protein BCR34DRAFT_568834 [Clohesyomyces aquaticus]